MAMDMKKFAIATIRLLIKSNVPITQHNSDVLDEYSIGDFNTAHYSVGYNKSMKQYELRIGVGKQVSEVFTFPDNAPGTQEIKSLYDDLHKVHEMQLVRRLGHQEDHYYNL